MTKIFKNKPAADDYASRMCALGYEAEVYQDADGDWVVLVYE